MTRWKVRRGLFGVVAAAAGIMWGMIGDVRTESAYIHQRAVAAPAKLVAIVFGAGYSAQGLSLVLEDRVRTGAELYKAGRVRKLLMTGDNSRLSYNEPEAMRRYAIALGVPARDIVLDFAGFRTYDSLYRARDIFGIRQALLVTQSYHLPRALYTAHHLGIDAEGVAAEKHRYREQPGWDRRELFSICNAWLRPTSRIPAHIS